MNKPRIAFILPALRGGGVEKVVITLNRGFLENGFDVDIILAKAEGEFLSGIPNGVNVFDLDTSRRLRLLRSFLPLVKYFRNRKLDAIFPIFDGFELIVIVAVRISYIAKSRPFVIYSIHNVSKYLDDFPGYKHWLVKISTWLSLHWADGVVAVSNSVAKDFSRKFYFPLEKIKVIYNPILTSEIVEMSKEPLNHPWFNSKIPVILGIGRLNKQKDFPNLIKAFAIVHKEMEAKLVILGEGEERSYLENLISELHLNSEVELLGFKDNPYPYLKSASLFVLSSEFEGFPLVLVEALALGTPVISTDCPGGSSEILEGGKYGVLVPVGDPVALSKAIIKMLTNPMPLDMLQNRAMHFFLESATGSYLKLINTLRNRR